MRDAAKIKTNPSQHSAARIKNAFRIDGLFKLTNLDIHIVHLAARNWRPPCNLGDKRQPRNHHIKEFILESPEYLNDLETQLKSILIQESQEF